MKTTKNNLFSQLNIGVFLKLPQIQLFFDRRLKNVWYKCVDEVMIGSQGAEDKL